jgi:hypothetical protein
MRPGEPTQDSGRARHRVGALFRDTVFNNHTTPLAVFVGRELGVAVTSDGRYSSHWHQFIRECRTRDFFDVVTLVYRYLYWHVGDGTANWWRDVVRQIFADEHLASFPQVRRASFRPTSYRHTGELDLPLVYSLAPFSIFRLHQTPIAIVHD